MDSSPPPHDGIIFDMDGVLFDSEVLHVRAWIEVGPRHGLELDPDWIRGWIGRPDSDLVEHLRAIHGNSIDAVFADKAARFTELTRSELRPFPGVIERVEGLRRGRLPLAICTSTSAVEARRMLEATGLAPLFGILVSADDTRRHKPHPEPYLEAARRLGLDPSACAVIEDSPPGVESAVAAGCKVIAVSTNFPADRLAGAGRVFPATTEAIDWLTGI